jgi:hypothetical protein
MSGRSLDFKEGGAMIPAILEKAASGLPIEADHLTLRQRLAEAIEVRQQADEAVREAETLALAANQFVASSESEFAKFGDLDRHIAEAHSAVFKEAHRKSVEEGQPAPARNRFWKLPGEIRKKILHRDAAAAQLQMARSAAIGLEQELAAAKVVADKARVAVEAAARDVAVAEIDGLGQELRAIERAAMDLRVQLVAASRLWIQGEGAVRLSPQTVNLLRYPPKSDFQTNSAEAARAMVHTATWQAYFRRLCIDAGAPFDDGERAQQVAAE